MTLTDVWHAVSARSLIMTTVLLLMNFGKRLLPFVEHNQIRCCSFAQKRINKMECSVKSRDDPVIMKLDSKEFKSIFNDEVCTLKALFEKYGYEIRLAGGPVRDLLMGIQPSDLDFATVATPQQLKEMFTNENVRMVNSNGEKHGTITPRINDKENFEVTTLRIDVSTDGRHADVIFTKDWKLDANRRDLTINSMFLGFDGSVYDYFYGYEDLMAKKIVFVGDADLRIKEDYLRILRYFRFYGRIAEHQNGHDEETLKCIASNAAGLQRISGERIWVEFKKILSGNFAGDLLKTMMDLQIGKYIGLPENQSLHELDKVWKHVQKMHYQPMILLASVLNNIEDVSNLNDRLKFSTFDRDLAYYIVEHRKDKISIDRLLPYQKLFMTAKTKPKVIREYIVEILKYRNDLELLEDFNKWEMPRFPFVTTAVLNKNGVLIPKMYGVVLNALKDYWANNKFDVKLEELEKQIPIIMNNINVADIQYEKFTKTKKIKKN